MKPGAFQTWASWLLAMGIAFFVLALSVIFVRMGIEIISHLFH